MFTIEEITLMNIYIKYAAKRSLMIKLLKNIISYFAEDEVEIKTLTLETIKKLENITDTEFSEIDFSQAICAE